MQAATSSITLHDAKIAALGIKNLYDEMNQAQRGRTWTNEEFMLGFVGDVGDLAKLVMAAEGAREMPGGRAALAHELADCLWAVLVLADCYKIDLGKEFQRSMGELTTRIQGANEALLAAASEGRYELAVAEIDDPDPMNS